MSNTRLVWSDDLGDQRKAKETKGNESVNSSQVVLHVRRLTSGKGRTVIEISNLPKNDKWNKGLTKTLKKKLGCGGTYKNGYIEIHGEKIDLVTQILDKESIKWKKTGG